MTDHIAGNPATFPATVALWEDGDPPDAAHFNLGPEDLADRTANLDARVTAEVAARVAAINALYKIVDTTGSAWSAGGYGAQILDMTSGSYVSIAPETTITFTSKANPGDVLEVSLNGTVDADSGSVGSFLLRVTDAATNTDLSETERQTGSAGGLVQYNMTARYVCPAGASGRTVTVTWRAKRVSGAGHVHAYNPTSMVARLLRPGS